MSEEQSDKLKLNLKTTDTNRFKIEADQPTEQPAEQLPKTDAKPAQIDELEAQRKVNTGSFKRVDVSGQAPANAAIPGVGDGGLKKSETVRLKVVRATPAGAPAAGPAASTVKLNLKHTDDAAPAVPTPTAPSHDARSGGSVVRRHHGHRESPDDSGRRDRRRRAADRKQAGPGHCRRRTAGRRAR